MGPISGPMSAPPSLRADPRAGVFLFKFARKSASTHGLPVAHAAGRAHGPARPADCYVTVQLAGEHRREVRKTRVVSASRNPVWNADFALFVDDAARAELLLSAFDFSGLEAHIPMGAVRLPLLDVVAEQGGGPGVRASYRLEGAPSGHLHLWLEWRAY